MTNTKTVTSYRKVTDEEEAEEFIERGLAAQQKGREATPKQEETRVQVGPELGLKSNVNIGCINDTIANQRGGSNYASQ